jgi:hypothetical protein
LIEKISKIRDAKKSISFLFLSIVKFEIYYYTVIIMKVKLSRTDQRTIIKKIIDRYDPVGLLKSGCPQDEYSLEADQIESRINNRDLNIFSIKSIIKSIFNEYFNNTKMVNCSKIAYEILSEFEFADFVKDFTEKEEFKNKIEVLDNYIIKFRINDNFIVESSCGFTYINGKYYYGIEDQDLLNSFYNFLNSDKIYIQYKHKHFFLFSYSYFKEIKKSKFSYSKIKHKKDIDKIFNNKGLYK